MDATGVWLLLLAGGFVVLALVGLAALSQQPRKPRPDLARLRGEADELTAHAVAVQAEAERAAAAAVEAREAVLAAERIRDDAWAAQEAAERTYNQALRAAVAGRSANPARGGGPRPTDRPTDRAADRAAADRSAPERDAERERAVSRAALSAYRRGDISVRELQEVFRRTGKWDPAQQERERVADGDRIAQAAARRDHDRATAAVRRTDQAARIAEIAAQALLDEAAESAAEAQSALLTLERHAGRRRFR